MTQSASERERIVQISTFVLICVVCRILYACVGPQKSKCDSQNFYFYFFLVVFLWLLLVVYIFWWSKMCQQRERMCVYFVLRSDRHNDQQTTEDESHCSIRSAVVCSVCLLVVESLCRTTTCTHATWTWCRLVRTHVPRYHMSEHFSLACATAECSVCRASRSERSTDASMCSCVRASMSVCECVDEGQCMRALCRAVNFNDCVCMRRYVAAPRNRFDWLL